MKKQILTGLLLAFSFQQVSAMGSLTTHVEPLKKDALVLAEAIKSMSPESKALFLGTVAVSILGLNQITDAYNGYYLSPLLEGYLALMTKLLREKCGPEYIVCLNRSLSESDLQKIKQVCEKLQGVALTSEEFNQMKSYIDAHKSALTIVQKDIKYKFPAAMNRQVLAQLKAIEQSQGDDVSHYKVLKKRSQLGHALHTTKDSLLYGLCALIFVELLHTIAHSDTAATNALAVAYALIWILCGMAIEAKVLANSRI